MPTTRVSDTAIALAMFVLTSAIVGGLHAYPSHSSYDMPDGTGTLDWDMPVIYRDGWVSFGRTSYDPCIDADAVAELRADCTIPRSGFFYNLMGAMCSVCMERGLQPTIDMLRERIADAEQRTGHVYGDDDIILVIFNFVCSAIEYEGDDVLYGCPEYWATPAETLWVGKGDCEDTAILFVTLCRAFGYDAVLVRMDDVSDSHMMGGVRCGLKGDIRDGYTLAECTWSRCGWDCEISEDSPYGHEILERSVAEGALAGMCAYLKSWGRFVLGIKDALNLPINLRV